MELKEANRKLWCEKVELTRRLDNLSKYVDGDARYTRQELRELKIAVGMPVTPNTAPPGYDPASTATGSTEGRPAKHSSSEDDDDEPAVRIARLEAAPRILKENVDVLHRGKSRT